MFVAPSGQDTELVVSADPITVLDMVERGFPVKALSFGVDKFVQERALITDKVRSLYAERGPWPTFACFGPDAEELAAFIGLTIWRQHRLRDDATEYRRTVAGPPVCATAIARVRCFPADVVELVYHPTSPLLGTRVQGGPDSASGLDVAVGTLVVMNVGPDTGLRRWHKLLTCTNRRAVEGLPTVLVMSSAQPTDETAMRQLLVGNAELLVLGTTTASSD